MLCWIGGNLAELVEEFTSMSANQRRLERYSGFFDGMVTEVSNFSIHSGCWSIFAFRDHQETQFDIDSPPICVFGASEFQGLKFRPL
jgi:hypothetical protein